jgi:hypothetical protein
MPGSASIAMCVDGSLPILISSPQGTPHTRTLPQHTCLSYNITLPGYSSMSMCLDGSLPMLISSPQGTSNTRTLPGYSSIAMCLDGPLPMLISSPQGTTHTRTLPRHTCLGHHITMRTSSMKCCRAEPVMATSNLDWV